MSLDEQPSSITEIQDKLVERVREVEGGGHRGNITGATLFSLRKLSFRVQYKENY